MNLRRIMIGLVALGVLGASPASGAQGDDPDWPCIQRKVPELSMTQIWRGPDLPPEAAGWSKDATVAALVDDLAARRLELKEAQERIKSYKQGLAPSDRALRIAMLVQGLFDKMNRERAHVIAGIARYAHRQREMAASLRRETSEVDALRARPDADVNAVAVRTDRLMFQIRIFQERVKSLSYVCEVPTLIEQRLYALVQALAETPGAE